MHELRLPLQAYLCGSEIINLAGFGAARSMLEAAKACAAAEFVHNSPSGLFKDRLGIGMGQEYFSRLFPLILF